jgi:hypothetical protein
MSIRPERLAIHRPYFLCLFVNMIFSEVFMLNSRLFQEKEHEACDKCQRNHYKYIVSLIKVSKDECGDEVAENLGAHVEGPEKCKIKSFV